VSWPCGGLRRDGRRTGSLSDEPRATDRVSQGKPQDGIADFLATLIALLAPPVISQAIARRWGREERWFRFATALNWCQWVLPLIAAVLVLLAGFMVQAGVPMRQAVIMLCCVLLAYAFWLQWFLARRGLDLSGLRAAGLVVLVNLLTIALVAGPQLLELVAQSLLAQKG
jgi:uncharacterized membrane protein YphA (DoxX/SURF4 family)